MGFEFQPFRSDYGSTIGELLGHSADAQAAALRAKAAAWSGAFTNIGQIVGALPQEIQQAHRQQTTDQLNDLKLADAKRQVAGQHAVAGMMAGDQLAPGDTGPRRESYLGDDGLFDIKKITASLGSSGFGDMAGDLVSGAEKINDSILKHQQLQQQTSDAHTVMLGDLANGALKLGKTGMPIDQAMDFVVQPALATKRIDPAEYAQVRQQLLQLPADQQGAALTALMDQAAKLDKGETLAEGAQRIDRYGRVVASGAPKPKTKAELAVDAANPDSPTQGMSTAALTKLAPAVKAPNSQESEFELDGKVVKGDYLPGANGQPGKYFYNGQDVTARARAKPTQATGNATAEQDNAKVVASSLIDGTGDFSVLEGTRATTQGVGLLAEIKRQGGDAGKMTRDWIATKHAISSLNSNQQIRLTEAISKASESLDKVEELSDEWAKQAPQWGIKTLNRVSLKAAQNGAYGSEAASVAQRLDAQIADVTSELGQTVMGGNSPTDHALSLASKNLSSDWTQPVLADAIKQARYNLNLAQNARNDLLQKLGVTATQAQTPGVATAPAATTDKPATHRFNPKTGKIEEIK